MVCSNHCRNPEDVVRLSQSHWPTETEATRQPFYIILAQRKNGVNLERIRETFEGNTRAHICMTDPFDKKTARTVHSRVSDETLRAHLRGETRIGFFPFVDGSRCKYAGWDIDTEQREDLRAVCGVIVQAGFPHLVEVSKSRGWHVWLLCDRILATKLRRFGLWVIEQAGMTGVVKEFFPKQTDPEKTGNALWFPLFGSESQDPALNNGRCKFIDASTGGVLDQKDCLNRVTLLRESSLDELQCYSVTEPREAISLVGLGNIPTKLPERFFERLQVDEKLMDAWTGKRRPPEDTTGSGHDMMLAGMLLCRRFTKAETARILLEYLLGRGKEAKDDYLKRTISKAEKWAREHTGPYRIEGGRICHRKPIIRKGEAVDWDSIQLSNFTARVAQQVTRDNGVEVTKNFIIDGNLEDGQPLPRTEVPAMKFSSLNWIVDGWGIQARISAGYSGKDRLREAIQCLSTDVKGSSPESPAKCHGVNVIS